MSAPYGICMRCGFKRHLNELCKEWSGSRVCRDTCRDPRPADQKPPRYRPEGVPVPNAAPEPPIIYGRKVPVWPTYVPPVSTPTVVPAVTADMTSIFADSTAYTADKG